MTTVSTFTMKLVRADEHLKVLNDEVAAFLQIRPYEVVTQQDVPGGNVRAHVVYRHAPPAILLMLIGDVLYNLRSALDHVAWSLAGTNADTRTEFPIFADKFKFCAVNSHGIPKPGSGLLKMHDMPVSAQAVIESLQPYNGSYGLPECAPLWLLQASCIEDKHHTLNLVAAGMEGNVHVGTGRHPAYGLTGTTGYLMLEDGTEVFHMPGPVDQSSVQDYSRYTFDVAFDPKGPTRGIRLREGLRDMREAVAEAIRLLESFVP